MKRSYDQIAEAFDTTRKYPWKEFSFLSEGMKKNQTVLDIGCGNGRLHHFLQPFCPEYKGVDISPEQIKRAKKNVPDGIFSVGDFEHLPFQDTSFDEVWMLASFHHLSSQKRREKALQEMSRVLRPQGLIKGTVWNLWQPKFRWHRWKSAGCLRWRHLMIPWKDASGKMMANRYYFAFTASELQSLFEQKGFEVLELFGVQGNQKVSPMAGRNICFIAKKTSRIFVHGVPFDAETLEEIGKKTEQLLSKKQQQYLFATPNPEMVIEAQSNPKFLAVLKQTKISLPDGIGILWATAVRGKPWYMKLLYLFLILFDSKKIRTVLPERVTGVAFFERLMHICEKKGETVFLLGAAPGVADKTALILQKKYLQIQVVGAFSGNPEQPEACIKKINESNATILCTAFGAPRQELFLAKYLSKMPKIRIAVGLGGTFDFMTGMKRRAPLLFQKMGIEWLWRLTQEPSRWKRIWSATGGFIWMILGAEKKRLTSDKKKVT